MEAYVEWNRCRGGGWCTLDEPDLADEHFHDLEGVYVMWYGEENQVALRVGHGMIRDCLFKERDNIEIRIHGQQYEIYVTWAQVGQMFRDRVAKYITQALKPKLANSYPGVSPIEVNLPWSEETFPWE